MKTSALSVVLVVLVSACAAGCSSSSSSSTTSADRATITGSIYAVGGPSTPSADSKPLSGRVTLKAAGPSTTVTVAANGRYTAQVRPGRYTVTGESPELSSSIGNGPSTPIPCRAFAQVTATVGATIHVNVYCQIR